MARERERTYTEDEIKARLQAELPHWYLEDGWIRRQYKTNSWKGTLMVINTVGHLAEAAWHHLGRTPPNGTFGAEAPSVPDLFSAAPDQP